MVTNTRRISGLVRRLSGLFDAMLARIEAHDGRLTLKPRASGGLCVTIDLPIAAQPKH